MSSDWLPPEFNMLNMWTELVEMCDWDEEKAASAIARISLGDTRGIHPKIISHVKVIINMKDRKPEIVAAES